MILVIDNYDSFTYNLVQLLAVAGAEVRVLRNDAATVEEVLALAPRGIVLSPGPGRPESAGICLDLLRARPPIPLLGVCLGHQALGFAFGAEVRRAPRLMHGKASGVRHRGEGLFAGLPERFEAGRYHSLEVPEDSLTDELIPQAWTDPDEPGGTAEETLMAMSHRELPYWGVQFHPESILTAVGEPLARNFLDLCVEARKPGAPAGRIAS